MTGLLRRLAFLAFACLAAQQAHACSFVLNDKGVAKRATLADIPTGIAAGVIDCGKTRYPAQVWTLAVDPDRTRLGVRDNKLFDQQHTGPLDEIAAAGIEDHARIHVMERAETAALSRRGKPVKRNGFRRFVTFCDATGTDPLDCSIGGQRIKARVSAKHADRDGYPDISLHEISIYDGAARLHVMSFVAPYSARAEGDMSRWISAINAVSDVLSPMTTGALR